MHTDARGHLKRPLSLSLLILCLLLGAGVMFTGYPWVSPKPIVTIRVIRHGSALPDGFFLYHHLSAEGIAIESITPEHETLVIRFNSPEESEAAQKVLKRLLTNSYVVS